MSQSEGSCLWKYRKSGVLTAQIGGVRLEGVLTFALFSPEDRAIFLLEFNGEDWGF